MPSLLETQRAFAAALEVGQSGAQRGFDVYHSSIAGNYRRALAATFPVVRALVGDAFFNAAVDAFVAAHPPASGDLNVYGGELGEFLERYAPAATLPYLGDVARLEWALDESARAADVDVEPREIIAAIGMVEEDAVAQLRLGLHPSCRLLSSPYPVYDVWRVHQADAGDMRVDFETAATERLMTRRDHGRTMVERLGAGAHAWLQALGQGRTFAEALAIALEAEPDFDLAEALHARVHDCTICRAMPSVA